MNQKEVLVDVSDRIATVTLNRPEKRNALNDSMCRELQTALDGAANNPEVKAIVIAAEGKAFCAGADLDYLRKLQSNSFEENLEDSRNLAKLFRTIYACDKVVIASVQGHAIAGGCGLATVCDFAIAVPEAGFGYSEVRIGFVPAIVGVFLVRKLGEGKARQLLLSGKMVTAAEALQAGMIAEVVEANRLTEHTRKFASELCSYNSFESMKLTKKLIAESTFSNLDESLEIAAKINANARATGDCKKGIAAFLNKEEIRW